MSETRTILSKEELEKLLKVPTTVEQAQQIVNRNEAMLDYVNEVLELIEADGVRVKVIDALNSEKNSIGCPHCSRRGSCFDCCNCAYQLADVDGSDEFAEIGTFECCQLYFGGLKFEDVKRGRYCELDLCTDSISVFIYSDCCVWAKHPEQLEVLRNDLEKIKRFLEGHVEWAEEVIALGGVPWPEDHPNPREEHVGVD